MTTLPIPTHLSVNGKASPLSMDKHTLSFAWQLPLGIMQRAYRLTFAHSVEDLQQENYVFDTGWIESNQSTAVKVDGLADKLQGNHAYVWQVAYIADTGEDTPLLSLSHDPFVSGVATFTTSPVFTHTHGIWSAPTGEAIDNFMFARHEFDLSAKLLEQTSKAVLTVTATSPEEIRQYVYLAYVNGECVGVGPTRLGKDIQGGLVLYYQSYDVTPLLTSGKNCLSAICYALSKQAFFCQLTLFDKYGDPLMLCNTHRDMANWRVLGGDKVFRPDASIGSHYYVSHANNIDGSCYPFGFSQVGFDDSTWSHPQDKGDLRDQMQLLPCPSGVMNRYLAPKDIISVTKTPDGDYIIDIGKEIVGGLGLYIPHCPDMNITIMYGEEMLDPYHVKFEMRTGNKYREVWHITENMPYVENISMMTYRYVQISGCPVDLTPDMIYPLSLRCDFDDDASDLETSVPLLKEIYDLMKHTVKFTTQDLYVDAQSRERLAYEGDLVINQLASYAFGGDMSVSRFSIEYLITHRTWPAEYPLFTVMGAWLDFMACGDSTLIQTYYPALRDLVTRYTPDETGLVRHITNAMSTTDGILVDWPLSERDGYDMDMTYNTVFNACLVGAYGALADMADLLGYTQETKTYQNTKNSLVSCMTDWLYDHQTGAFCDGCMDRQTKSTHTSQHATAFALAFDVYKGRDMAQSMANFLESTGKIRMSVYGAFFLLAGLYRSNHGDLANKFMLSEDTSVGAHTWAAMIRSVGATITTEAWHPTGKPNMTHAHPWGAAPAHLIMSGIFGITPTAPAYNTFDIRLQASDITHAALTLPTIKGEIYVAYWQDKATHAQTVTVLIPGNTTATLRVPARGDVSVMLDGVTLPPRQYTTADGYVSLVLPSGGYEVTVAKATAEATAEMTAETDE